MNHVAHSRENCLADHFTALLRRLLMLASVCLFLSGRSFSQESELRQLDQGAPGYYSSSKPYTRWWWFASTIQKQDVERQLDWIKANNFGGVEIAWVYPLNIERYKKWYTWISDQERGTVTPRQEWLSPEWSEIVAHAKRYGDKIGLGVDFTFGTAWPFGDSKVARRDAGRFFDSKTPPQRNIISWEYPKKGLILDHLNSKAFEHYGERLGKALAPALKGNISGLFCDSWEVEANWTSGFDKAFKKRFGYDVKPYMPGILSGAGNRDVRYDYMKFLSDYILRNFYEPYTALAHRLGAFSRVQCAGSPTDILTAYAGVDVPETEALLYEPPFSRIVASAAALAGKKVVTSETFTCTYGFPRDYHKQEQVADLKLIADAVFANGVNQIIWHGTPFQSSGASHENEFYASVHIGPGGRLAKDLAGFNSYLEKVSAYLKGGSTYSNIAEYLPMEDGWIAGPYPKELLVPGAVAAFEMRYVRPAEELREYAPLWINQRFLADARLENGLLHTGNASFSALYVDAEYLDRDSLAAVLRIAGTGFPVCLKRKPKEPGLRKSSSFESDLARLSGLKNVTSDISHLQGAVPLVKGKDLPDFWCRVSRGEYYIFFAHPLAQNLRLPLRYGQSLCGKDAVRPVEIAANGRISRLDLVFKPYQSIMVKVGLKGEVSFPDISYNPPVPVLESR
jgi:hypothetical protein